MQRERERERASHACSNFLGLPPLEVNFPPLLSSPLLSSPLLPACPSAQTGGAGGQVKRQLFQRASAASGVSGTRPPRQAPVRQDGAACQSQQSSAEERGALTGKRLMIYPDPGWILTRLHLLPLTLSGTPDPSLVRLSELELSQSEVTVVSLEGFLKGAAAEQTPAGWNHRDYLTPELSVSSAQCLITVCWSFTLQKD